MELHLEFDNLESKHTNTMESSDTEEHEKDNTCQGLTLRKKKCLNKHMKGEKYCKRHKDKFKLEKPEDCIVCMEKLKYNSLPLSCSHWVCRKCIIKWKKDICPVCRSKIKLYSKERKIMELKKSNDDMENIQNSIQNNIDYYMNDILQELYYMSNNSDEDEIYSLEEFNSILERIGEINIFIDDISDSDSDES